MNGDQAERAVRALERIGTGLLRLAAAAEKANADTPRPAPDTSWVGTRRTGRLRGKSTRRTS